MAAFRRFEDILAWQKAREITKTIYRETLRGDFAKDFELRGQIRRASISIMANIAEGFGRKSDKEFANFLNIAHASAYEVQSHLYIAVDLDYIADDAFAVIYDELGQICRMLFALRQTLNAE